MSVRLRSLVLTSAVLSTLALALPSATAVAGPDRAAEPAQREHVDRSLAAERVVVAALSRRVADNATVVARPTAPSAGPTSEVTVGRPQEMSDAQEREAVESGLGALPGSGTISASTDAGTWHFDHGPGLWSPTYIPSELNTSWSPAGDRYVTTSSVNGVWTDHVRDPWTGAVRDYPSNQYGYRAVAWSSTGAELTRKLEGTPANDVTIQSVNPKLLARTQSSPHTATHGPPVLNPVIDQGYSRVALSPTTSDITKFTLDFPSATFQRMFIDRFRPGNPAVAQPATEALGDYSLHDAPTQMAFLGVDPVDPTKGHLYWTPSTHRAYTDTVPVADVPAHPECDLPAPAFSADRRVIVFATAEGEAGDACSRTALHSLTAGSNGRFDAADATTSLEWWGTQGEPYRTLSMRDATLPLVDAYRISGQNRYEVGVNTSQAFFDDASADAVVVSGGTAYADALAGGPLAGSMGGPVLLTYPTSLHPGVAAEIDRVLSPGGTVYITGGTASVSASVEAALTRSGRTVKRLAGANRYAVAVNIAKELDRLRGGVPHAAFVAGGTAFADALVAGPAAVHEDGPILLATGTGLDPATLAYLDSVDNDPTFRAYGVGGAGAHAVASRPNDVQLTGASRYDVALAVADHFFSGEHIAALADGRNWPDAVAGGAVMSGQGAPIMLTNGLTLPRQTAGRISQSASAVDMVLAFGGPASIPSEPLWDAADLAGMQTPLWGPDTGS